MDGPIYEWAHGDLRTPQPVAGGNDPRRCASGLVYNRSVKCQPEL